MRLSNIGRRETQINAFGCVSPPTGISGPPARVHEALHIQPGSVQGLRAVRVGVPFPRPRNVASLSAVALVSPQEFLASFSLRNFSFTNCCQVMVAQGTFGENRKTAGSNTAGCMPTCPRFCADTRPPSGAPPCLNICFRKWAAVECRKTRREDP